MTLPVIVVWHQYAALSHGKVLAPLGHDAFAVNEQRLIRSTERIAATLKAAARTDRQPLFLVNTITGEIVEVRRGRKTDIAALRQAKAKGGV